MFKCLISMYLCHATVIAMMNLKVFLEFERLKGTLGVYFWGAVLKKKVFINNATGKIRFRSFPLEESTAFLDNWVFTFRIYFYFFRNL